MSKLANPWKCDAPGCGVLRANDGNHWLLVWVVRNVPPVTPKLYVVTAPWDDEIAEQEEMKHCCGVNCACKTSAQLIVKNLFPNEVQPAGTAE